MNKILFMDSNTPYERLNLEAKHVIESGFDYHTYGKLPFTGTLTGLFDLNPLDTYLVRCSTNILKHSIKDTLDFKQNPEIESQFHKGIFYNNDTFKMDYIFEKYWKLPFLNMILDYQNTSDILYQVQTEDIFIKPIDDLKAYNACVILKGQCLNDVLQKQQLSVDYLDGFSIIASARNDIQRECRFFVVDGVVITGSQYRLNNKPAITSINPKDGILLAAQKYSDLYHPHDNFVIDIATLDNGDYKVIEYNCLNASGLYACDSKLLFQHLFQYLGKL